ncbi:MAG: hypothetical protein LH477_07660 [Nocardioides sp.]|nr:hypothetical protein [Nocardioides sp.]
MGSARVVWLAALAAFLSRFPSVLWPLRPDEAGFLLVARSWNPEPDSVYGRYFVDRPPPIIWLIKATDAAAGPYAHRFVGAVGCALLVLAAAAAAREVLRWTGPDRPEACGRVAGWTAVATAAMVGNAQIDALSAKGELLGIPFVMGACWLALRSVRLASWPAAFGGGLLAILAVGMKQSIVGGLVFGAVVLVGSVLTRRITRAVFLRLAVAAAAGVAVPVLATMVWAWSSGVRLATLWYAVAGFRADAGHTLAQQDSGPAQARMLVVLAVVLGTGMALVAVWFVIRVPGLARQLPVVACATLLTVTVDAVGVVISGSYWLPYLFVLVPGLALTLACVLALDAAQESASGWQQLTRLVVLVVALSSVVSLATWTVTWSRGGVPREYRIGEAISRASRPGDTLVVYGGRADLQLASGMPSTYPYLWSLPMRTLDPGLRGLRDLLTGARAPTWVVEAASLDAWSELGTRPIERSLLTKYELVTTACDRYRIFHLNTVDPVALDVDCSTPWRTIWSN